MLLRFRRPGAAPDQRLVQEMCTLFVAPDGCKVVEGAISKDGWCKAFAAVD
ncbi:MULTISPECIES: hypothetical protein [Bradyrhizobium]|uniref:hypothetical protein n=1 Tax=Bradyrhizobium TaxID=374 RepID=UPI0024B069E2|nr:hypothetical protein [Bradyrhizobium australafricanum]WFU34768.1 hypothetical protein QA635_10345 [Bradyrhizobium australafricanum]